MVHLLIAGKELLELGLGLGLVQGLELETVAMVLARGDRIRPSLIPPDNSRYWSVDVT